MSGVPDGRFFLYIKFVVFVSPPLVDVDSFLDFENFLLLSEGGWGGGVIFFSVCTVDIFIYFFVIRFVPNISLGHVGS
jgi:hypothetical protein